MLIRIINCHRTIGQLEDLSSDGVMASAESAEASARRDPQNMSAQAFPICFGLVGWERRIASTQSDAALVQFDILMDTTSESKGKGLGARVMFFLAVAVIVAGLMGARSHDVANWQLKVLALRDYLGTLIVFLA